MITENWITRFHKILWLILYHDGYHFSSRNGEFGAPNDVWYNLSHSISMANPIALRLFDGTTLFNWQSYSNFLDLAILLGLHLCWTQAIKLFLIAWMDILAHWLTSHVFVVNGFHGRSLNYFYQDFSVLALDWCYLFSLMTAFILWFLIVTILL